MYLPTLFEYTVLYVLVHMDFRELTPQTCGKVLTVNYLKIFIENIHKYKESKWKTEKAKVPIFDLLYSKTFCIGCYVVDTYQW